MKRSGFKWKPRKPMKRTGFNLKNASIGLRRTPLSQIGKSPIAIFKRQIQAKLREYVILRDGGCILRHYPEAGKCGSRETKDGHMVLQAEHLHTRANAASFADERLVVCLCERHHIFYKPQYPDDYYRIVKLHIGPERTALLERVQNDRMAHKVDLVLSLFYLEQALKKLKAELSTP